MLSEKVTHGILVSALFVVILPKSEKQLVNTEGEEQLEFAITHGKHIIVLREEGRRHWLPRQLAGGKYANLNIMDGSLSDLTKAIIQFNEMVPGDSIDIYSGEF